MTPDITIDRAAFEKKAFAMLDAMSASGMGDKEVGLVLLGMAASALTEGGVTREQVHALIDRILDERPTA